MEETTCVQAYINKPQMIVNYLAIIFNYLLMKIWIPLFTITSQILNQLIMTLIYDTMF
jgi:hypothetical protein